MLPRRALSERAGFWTILAFSLVLRLIGLGVRPFDGDEGVIARIADGSFGQVLATAAADVHPPLYHLLVSVSLNLFGLSEWSVRLVGVLAGVGLVALAPGLAKRYGVPFIPLALTLATSPFLVYLAQDARMYSLFVFLATASWLMSLRLYAGPLRRDQLLLLTVLHLALVYTHHLGWLVLAGEVLVGLLLYRATLLKHWLWWVGSLGAVLLGYAWQLPITLNQIHGRLAEQAATTSFADAVKGVVGALYRFLAGRTVLDVSPGHLLDLVTSTPLLALVFAVTVCAPLILLVVALRTPVSESYRLPFRAIGIAAGLAAIVGVFVGSVGAQAARYLSYLAPLVLVILVFGGQRAVRARWGSLAIVAVAAVFGAGLYSQYAVHNAAPGLNAYATHLNSEARSGDVVLVRGAFAGGEAWSLKYYLGDAQLPLVDHFGEYRVGNLAELRALTPVDRIQSLIMDYERVWFFDQSYAAEPLAGLDPSLTVRTVELGADKEGQSLRLSLVERANAR